MRRRLLGAKSGNGRLSRRATRIRRDVILVGCGALGVATLAIGSSSAAFNNATSSTGNSFAVETLEPPSSLDAVASGSDAELSWDVTPDVWADGYEIWRSTTPGCCYALYDTVAGQPTSSYTDVGAGGGAYSYVVRSSSMSWRSTDTNENSCCAAVSAADSWTSLALTHSVAAGSDRLLVFMAGMENGADRDIIAVSYGHQLLVQGPEAVICAGVCARTEMWYLDEAGIQASTNNQFSVTWTGSPSGVEEHYSALTLEGVDQTSPIGDTSTNTVTSDPIQLATALNVAEGDIVIVASTAGNAGSYTPDTGYSEGIDTTGSTSVLATAHKQITTAGTEQPSMDFDNTINRHTILGLVVNGRPPVQPANAWTTGLTHTAGTGSNRALVFVAAGENNPDRDLTAVSYGGQSLIPIRDEAICSALCARNEVWYLGEAGIAAATDSTFVPTWASAPGEVLYSAVTLANVDQVTPIGPTGGTGTTTDNPIQIPTPINVDQGDLVIVSAADGEAATYSPDGDYIEGTDQASASMTLATASKAITTSGTTQPSMTFDAASNRQVISGVVFNAPTNGLADSWSDLELSHTAAAGVNRLLVFAAGAENALDRDLTAVTYGGQALTQASDEVICTTFCARTEFWYLNEAGIAAANTDELAVTWNGAAPDEVEEHYSIVTLDNVDQTSPIGDTSTNTSTANPIQVATALTVANDDMVLVAATAGVSASYTPDASYTEGTDIAAYGSTYATAFKAITAGGTEQPSMSYDATINRQSIVSIVVQVS